MEEALLNLITQVPREEVVYFQACSRPISTEVISAQLPYLRAMHFDTTPPDLAFPKSILDQGRMFLHLQHLTLDWVDECGDNWSPLTTFLDHLASSGNKLDTLEIGGSYDMHPRVEERVRSAVQEFRMKRDFFTLCDSPLYEINTARCIPMYHTPTSSCLSTQLMTASHAGSN